MTIDLILEAGAMLGYLGYCLYELLDGFLRYRRRFQSRRMTAPQRLR